MPKTVYEAHYDGLVFTLDEEGRIYARLRREPDAKPEMILATFLKDHPMTHRTFNKLCRESIKEGDCDDLLARKAEEDALRNAKKRHVDALYRVTREMAKGITSKDASCHIGICPPEECSRCGPILDARATLKAIDDDYRRRSRYDR